MPTSVWRQWLTPRLLNWTAKGFIRLSPRNLAPNLCSLLFFFYCVVLYNDVQYIILAISENAKAYCFLKNEEMLKQSSQDLYFFYHDTYGQGIWGFPSYETLLRTRNRVFLLFVLDVSISYTASLIGTNTTLAIKFVSLFATESVQRVQIRLHRNHKNNYHKNNYCIFL